jgi:hypothetical protein
MSPRLPTARQQQHRAYMSEAMASAPKHLSPREKMKWAAAGWQRQSKSRVGGMTHPGFHAVAESIAKREGEPIQNANAMLAASSRRASAQAKAYNPRLKKVKGGRIPIRERSAVREKPENIRQMVEEQEFQLLAESDALKGQLLPNAPPLSSRERNRITRRIAQIVQELKDLYLNYHVRPRQRGGGIASSLIKAAPHILKGIKLASKIAARVIGDKNQTASDVLDIIGGMGIKRQKADRAKKLAQMRRKQKVVHV